MAAEIKNIFVLMMENHSFDSIFGFSGIKGIDAKDGTETEINGLTGNETNYYLGVPYKVYKGDDDSLPTDPGHEFTDTVEQLCGEGKSYPKGGPYPGIDNSGFVANYATTNTEGKPPINDFGEIMRCYDTPVQLPVIYQLATEFAVCDNWFSSLPGPTWPNRFFIHGASSNGLDHSPSLGEMALWETLEGFGFENGSIFETLDALKIPWRLYNDEDKCLLGGQVPIVSALKGIRHVDVHNFRDFSGDLQKDYPAKFTFIEPNYGDVIFNTYKGGSSQHPMDDITSGEAFIKNVYEAIRNSSLWESSLLVITYDEHGGFYDHVKPPVTVAPEDDSVKDYNQYGFDFMQYGVRVPAVIISPLIPKNTIDHTLYDHTSVLSTLEDLFTFQPLTQRDGNANTFTALLSLDNPRTDCPLTLNDPLETTPSSPPSAEVQSALSSAEIPESGTLRGVLHIMLKTEFQLSDQSDSSRQTILANYANIKTRGDAKDYVNSVSEKLKEARPNKG